LLQELRLKIRKYYKHKCANLFYEKGKKSTSNYFYNCWSIINYINYAFFLLKRDVLPGIGEKPEENPGGFLENCIEDKLIEGIKLISSQGGYIGNPLNRTFKFSDEKEYTDISYLCYTNLYYKPCVMQVPFLKQKFSSELKMAIAEKGESVL